MPAILESDVIKELEKYLSVLVEGMEARETEGQETRIREKEQPSMKPMYVPSAIKVAEMFLQIEELANNLGLHIALDYLFKSKQWFLCASARRQREEANKFLGILFAFRGISCSLARGLEIHLVVGGSHSRRKLHLLPWLLCEFGDLSIEAISNF